MTWKSRSQTIISVRTDRRKDNYMKIRRSNGNVSLVFTAVHYKRVNRFTQFL